ncbi:MAG: BTAD domain-containing putative transcriptional regulator [Caldilineaceae bacterium]
MLPPLTIHLFGRIDLFYNDAVLPIPKSRKGLLLFLYLACTGRAHTREALADLLWDTTSTKQSLSNLRTVLSRLPAPLADYLLITRETVGVDPACPLSIDVLTLEGQVATSVHAITPETAPQLAAALERYQGEFCSGIHVADAPRFSEWVMVERGRLHYLALDGYQRLTAYHLERGDYETGISVATAMLRLDPTDEAGHGQLMRMLAYTGQRSAALAQFETCRAALQAEFGVEPDEALQEIYRQVRDSTLPLPAVVERETAAAHGTSSGSVVIAVRPRHNLPTHLTSFHGRTEELATLLRSVRDPATRLITLLGEGGIGKTRLAQTVGLALVDEFADGVWFVPLAGIAAGNAEQVEQQLAGATAQALGFQFSDSSNRSATLSSQLVDYVRAKSLLLILDNFEQLTIGAPFVIDLLQQAPNVQVLVTSRVALACQSELIVRLEGLSFSATAEQAITASAGLQLFARRAQRLLPDFALDAATTPTVAELCTTVQGNPLALELAANWVQHFTIEEMVATLQRRDLSLLTTDQLDLPVRHRSIQSVFETSWSLLTPEQQRVWAQLAIFRGGFTRQAAMTVAGATVAHLVTLVNRSLLRQSAPGHYELHELLRQFAEAKLAQWPPEQHAALNRHATYYLQWVQNQEAQLQGAHPQLVVAALSSNIDNIQQAWRHAIGQQQWPEIGGAIQSLSLYYQKTGLYRDAIVLFAPAVDTLLKCVATAEAPAQEAMYTLGFLLAEQAWAYYGISANEQTIAAAQQAIVWGQRSHSLAIELRANLFWGEALYHQGAREHANEKLVLARQIAENIGDQQMLARCLTALARISLAVSYQQTYAYLQQADSIFTQLGAYNWLSEINMLFGNYYYQQEQMERAEHYYKKAIDLGFQVGNRSGQGTSLGNLANIYDEQGDFHQAIPIYQQVIQIFEDTGARLNLAITLGNLGKTLRCQGNYSEARAYLERALQVSQQIQDWVGVSFCKLQFSVLEYSLGAYEIALALAQEAQQIVDRINEQSNNAAIQLHIGTAQLKLGRIKSARQALESALQFPQSLNVKGAIWIYFAELCWLDGQLDKANDYIAAAKEYLSEPHRVSPDAYYIAYKVSLDSGNADANTYLQRGYEILQDCAKHIPQEELRRQYLSVPIHKELATVAREQRPTIPMNDNQNSVG